MSFINSDHEFQNWVKFCQNENSKHKAEDFYSLLMEERNPQQLQNILKPLSQADALYERLSHYLDINKPEWESSTINADHALELAVIDLTNKLNAYQEHYSDRLGLKIDTLNKFRVNDLPEFKSRRESSVIHENFIQGVNDFVIANDKLGSRLSYALSEMYYGLTTSFEMVWYLMEPLIHTQHSFSNYFKLAYFGYDYFIEDNGLVLICPAKPK